MPINYTAVKNIRRLKISDVKNIRRLNYPTGKKISERDDVDYTTENFFLSVEVDR